MKNFKKVCTVNFPKPTGININMMPFIMGDINSIPEEFRQYKDIINSCNIVESELNKVGYLTITESFVNTNNSQRRGGIHTEKHPSGNWGGGGTWGGRAGGIFMSSNVSNSCEIWNHNVDQPKKHGDCEHLRDFLGGGTKMKKGELFWLTDSTPHESLPLNKNTYRQFFRLVTNDVSIWYKEHSTDNRLGILPDCKILDENKFDSIK